jgi:hypothetical protein
MALRYKVVKMLFYLGAQEISVFEQKARMRKQAIWRAA